MTFVYGMQIWNSDACATKCYMMQNKIHQILVVLVNKLRWIQTIRTAYLLNQPKGANSINRKDLLCMFICIHVDIEEHEYHISIILIVTFTFFFFIHVYVFVELSIWRQF